VTGTRSISVEDISILRKIEGSKGIEESRKIKGRKEIEENEEIEENINEGMLIQNIETESTQESGVDQENSKCIEKGIYPFC